MICDLTTVALIVVPLFLWGLAASIGLAIRIEKLEKRLDGIEKGGGQ